MLILSPCLKIGVVLAIFKSGGIIPVSHEELIMAETTPATDSMVFLVINGSITSGPGEREYFAKFAKLITSWGLVGSRPNYVGSGELIQSYMLFSPLEFFVQGSGQYLKKTIKRMGNFTRVSNDPPIYLQSI